LSVGSQVEAINNDFSGEYFAVLGIDFWDGSSSLVQNYQNATGATYPLLLNGSDYGIPQSYNCSYHYFFIIDHLGVIAWRGHFNDGLIRAQIATALENAQSTPALDIPTSTAKLHAAYPNPFNPMTSIAYQTDLEGDSQMVRLDILDLRGRVVRTLVNTTVPAGFQDEAVWDGQNAEGKRVPSGSYISRLRVGNFSQSRLLTLIK